LILSDSRTFSPRQCQQKLHWFGMQAATTPASQSHIVLPLRDGLVHVIGTAPTRLVYVEDGPAAVGTTVNILDQARIGTDVAVEGVGLFADEHTVANIRGGELRGTLAAVASRGRAIANIYGGRFTLASAGLGAATLAAIESSNLNIAGGQIQGPAPRILAADEATVNLVGRQFNWPFGTLKSQSGHIGGTLLDGSPIELEFRRTEKAVINLLPPDLGASLSGGHSADRDVETSTHGSLETADTSAGSSDASIAQNSGRVPLAVLALTAFSLSVPRLLG